jgi:hypothetical protein
MENSLEHFENELEQIAMVHDMLTDTMLNLYEELRNLKQAHYQSILDLKTIKSLRCQYHELNQFQRKTLRQKYIKAQNHLCMHCYTSLYEQPPQYIREYELDMKLFPPNMLKYPIHLQHDHGTGFTEGAIHAKCNAVLWQTKGK